MVMRNHAAVCEFESMRGTRSVIGMLYLAFTNEVKLIKIQKEKLLTK